jgi:hypothetical protein
MSEFISANYISRIVFQLDITPAKTQKSDSVWWHNPSGYISKNLPFYSSTIRRKPTDFLLLGDKTSSPAEFVHYLSNSSQLSNFIMGGLWFFDFDSKEEISTNYDLGETEEWEGIIKDLKEKNSGFNTFSATDVPVELTIVSNKVIFQELSWEAIPDRLETSRQTAAKYIFIDKDKFIKEVEDCLAWWDLAIKEAEKLEKNRDEVLMSLSCNQRRQRARI